MAVRRLSIVTGGVHRRILALYLLLAVVLSWPLVPQMLTHVPGVAQWAFDESTFLWNTWYLKHTLLDRLQSPLHSELIWYPLGIDLILYTYNFFHALLAQPLLVAVNLPFASNSALLASTVLSGYGTFLLVRNLLARHRHRSLGIGPSGVNVTLAAFAAGALYAFASNRAIYAALGHYDMVTTQWIPFYALMLLRALEGELRPGQRRKAAALAGLFFAFAGLAEMITALFLGIFTVIVLAVHLLSRTIRWRQLPAVVGYLLLTGLVAALVWGPVLAPILTQFLTNDFSLQGWGEAIPLSTDLLGWFTPTALHPQWGTALVPELRRIQERALSDAVGGFRDLNTVFLGWASLTLAIIGWLRYRRQVRIWLWTSLIFGIFTLGPFLQINGRYRFDLDGVEATFPLPFVILHYLPIIKANRAPNRNSVLLMLGLAVLVGYGIHWLMALLTRWSQRRTPNGQSPITNLQSLLALLLTAAILYEHLALPLPLTDARVPAVYATIAADPEPNSILQIPLGWRNSFGVYGAERTQLQYYQTAHGKPMLGGNISRAPAFKMDYFQRLPLFQAIRTVEFGDELTPELAAAAQAEAADLLYLYNTEYVLLYPPIPERKPYADHWQATWDFVKATLPLETEPFWTGDGIEAYRVMHPAGSDLFTLDLGAPGTFAYRGEGWDEAAEDAPYGTSAIWATAAQSRLFLPLRQVDSAATYELVVNVHPYTYPGGPAQSAQLTVNEWQGERVTLTDGWQELRWQIPGRVLINSLNRAVLAWGWTAVPRTVLGGNRQIGTTGVTLPIDADLTAFADGGWIALFADETGHQIDAAAGRRGVNVTVLGMDGAIVEKAGFDTTANAFESEKLATFLGEIAAGQPVLVVSNGDATAHLTVEAVDALRNLGAEVSLDGLQGQHFAIIGVQGSAPGSAAIVTDPERAFLRISLERDRRSLAAAVDRVTIERLP
jgi:hypothetical protein